MQSNSINYKIDQKVERITQGINTLAIAKIINVDMKKMSADIELMELNEDGETTKLENIPILNSFLNEISGISVEFSQGDKVLIGFCKWDIFNSRNYSEPCEPLHKIEFSLGNAVIISKIFPSDFNSGPEFSGIKIWNGKQEIIFDDNGIKIRNKEQEILLAENGVFIKSENISVESNNISFKGTFNIEGGINTTEDGNIGGYSIKGLADKINEIIATNASGGGA